MVQAAMTAPVYVGIVTYNSVNDMPACIDCLRAQTYPNIHITVLDNASADGSAVWVRKHAPELTLIESAENLGYGRGHNAIIEACALPNDGYYMALNPDALLEPDYVAALLGALQSHDAGWGIGQLRLSADDGTHTDLLYSTGHGILGDGYAFNIGYRLPQATAAPTPHEVFGAPGAAVLYSAALINDISVDGAFFDPDLFLYYEDVDVDWRAQARGWGCLSVPDAVAWHRGSQPGGALKMQSLANRYGVAIKNATVPALCMNHLPRLGMHLVARLMLTPAQGQQFGRHLRRVLPRMWRKRSTTPRAPIRGWVRWSSTQPTGQPRSLKQRWRAFRRAG